MSIYFSPVMGFVCLLLLLEGAAGGFCGALKRERRRRRFEGTEEAFG